ncbi:MAG: hypothetical protein IJY22_02030, partial [Clostridia bacterium]|nr:hypothetical protein [Clostridia bacterium]
NCSAAVNVTVSTTSRSNYVGGLIGLNEYASASNCFATGAVTSSTTDNYGDDFVGGLIGYNSSPVTNSYATGNVSSTAYSSYAGGLIGSNLSESIENCYATGSVTGNDRVGGLVGSSSGGTIKNCRAEGDAMGFTNDYAYTAGGLIGWSSATIENCYAAGAVTGFSAGGLINTNRGTVKNSYATGNVIAISTAGGLVAYNYETGSITGCYATGNVTNTSENYEGCAGGLVAYNYGGSIQNSYATGDVKCSLASEADQSDCYAGGLVGMNDTGSTVTSCYATGNVTSIGSTNNNMICAGGLVGYQYESTLKNCYATGNVTSVGGRDDYQILAGGLLGYKHWKNTIENCYYFSGQSFTVTEGDETTHTATTELGTAKDMATLQSTAFQSSTLGFSSSDWVLVQGTHPNLKNAGVIN